MIDLFKLILGILASRFKARATLENVSTTSLRLAKRTCAGSYADMPPIIMCRGPIDLSTRTPLCTENLNPNVVTMKSAKDRI